MIGRRPLLAGLTALPLAQARAGLPVPAGSRLAFHIIRKGSTIGEHSIDFAQAGDLLTVSVAADIVVGLGPIAFFRYSHRATEQWQAGQVVSVDAKTNDDGTPRHMSARRDESGLVVEGSTAARYVAPPRSLPATHWNRAMLDAPFINTEDGRLMSPRVTPVGMENFEVTGGSLQCQHYAVRGDANLDTFYDLTPGWVGLRFSAKDGSEVRYLRA
jgi:hypothetical protein